MEYTALGKLLIQAKLLVSEDEATQIAQNAKENKISFLGAVIKVKKVEPTQIATFLSQKFQLPYLDLDYFDLAFVPNEIDVKLIDKNKVLPIKKQGNVLFVAVADPTDTHLFNDLKFQTGATTINLIVVEYDKLIKLIDKFLQLKGANFAKDLESDGFELEIETTDEDEKSKDTDVEDAPVVKFIQSILLEAIKLKVSDIHFEPYEKIYRVRFRLDGALYESKKAPVSIKEKIASRIKVISSLDISEKRVPQDGRFKLKISADRAIDFRVSTLPTLWGEKIVMRILDSSPAMLDLDKLGYSVEQKAMLVESVGRPYGMVLVTGPTGSGKTVSLYSCLQLLNKEDVNICTAEDPAEINMPGVNQVNMNEKAGLTFSATLKSFLRQDPDTILVGEIRDLETADIAIKAAQTGHMVLSTLHTNDAPKTITRLLNMGVKPFNIASSVIMITAQRLGRKLCPLCKVPDDIPAEVLLSSGLPLEELDGYGSKWKMYKPVGCSECGDKGYKGRVGIYQVMPITEEIRKIILREGTDIEIAVEAKLNGVLSLRESGLLKAKEGITSVAEVIATTNLD
ncbi:type IV-A pilus assembly ATPase PilB [archaeon]|nr:type IV-A pilus assembly ATPase PilB [archaeon]